MVSTGYVFTNISAIFGDALDVSGSDLHAKKQIPIIAMSIFKFFIV